MTPPIPFFSFAPQHEALRAELLADMAAVYDANWYIMGSRLAQFEADYAAWHAVQHVIGVANGLDALRIALLAVGVGAGDEVIVASNAYIACWLAVSQTNATVVPVEPCPDTANIDPERIEAAITPRTKAIMPVHLYGQSCQMDRIMDIAHRHGLMVVEDNAQGHGATCLDRKTGTWGHANATSFYPTKNLGALGDAGAITTQDDAIADFCRTYRNYGSREKYKNVLQGTNSRLDDLQAAILTRKLAHLDAANAERTRLAALYSALLGDLSDVEIPFVAPSCTSVWHLYVIRTARRDALQSYLQAQGIQTMIHYPIAPHLQVAYRDLGYKAGDFPIAERWAATCLSLPLYPGMPDTHVEAVAKCVHRFFGR
jgi:dTDP-4-amino-4,6-dideoxygalactose transaminase